MASGRPQRGRFGPSSAEVKKRSLCPRLTGAATRVILRLVVLEIHVAPCVTIPATAIEMRAVRSSGPGGQNVNKVASKVLLRVDLARIEGLAPDARERLHALVSSRLDADGRLLVTSQRFRDQPKNLEDAREKVRGLVARALARPKDRRASRPSAASRQRRLEGKRRSSQKKRLRHAVREDL